MCEQSHEYFTQASFTTGPELHFNSVNSGDNSDESDWELDFEENSDLESVLRTPPVASMNLDNASNSTLSASYECFETPIGLKRSCSDSGLKLCPAMKKRRISLFEKNEHDTRRVLLFDDYKSESPTHLGADSISKLDNSESRTSVFTESRQKSDMNTDNDVTRTNVCTESRQKSDMNTNNDVTRTNVCTESRQESNRNTDNDVIQAEHMTTKRNLNSLLNEEVPMSVGIELAKRHNLVVFKPSFYRFRLARNLRHLAYKVYMNYLSPLPNVCLYEMIPSTQATYADLDLKLQKAQKINREVLKKPFIIASRFVDLLELGYREYLELPFDRTKVIIGDGCRDQKFSFHFTYYDGKHC